MGGRVGRWVGGRTDRGADANEGTFELHIVASERASKGIGEASPTQVTQQNLAGEGIALFGGWVGGLNAMLD